MARNHWQQFLATMRAHEAAQTAAFASLSARLGDLLLREARADGKVPLTRRRPVREAVEREVTAHFLSATRDRSLAPFEVVMGRVVPLSPYATVLFASIADATRIAVDQQAVIMERALADAPDVLLALRNARSNPFAVAKRAAEFEGWKLRPFLEYDPVHRFVWPDGYTLSNRIWRTSVETRRKIDALLAEGLAEGKGSLELSEELERFLQPGRGLRRTNKPYGRYGSNASYDAMRLARTEITAAHSRAGFMSAQLNPFVQSYDVVLSGSHPKPDICDDVAAGGPYPMDDMEHLPPLHPHCVTPGQMVETLDGPVPIEFVQSGDTVRTHTGGWGRVLKSWSRPFDDTVYKFSTEAGQFELTGEHPVLLARGWVKAEDVQLGDQVVYAQANVLFDGILPVSEDAPSKPRKENVAPLIAGALALRIVPSAPVALNGNLNADQREINREAANRMLVSVDDAAPIQFSGHSALNAGGDAVSPHSAQGFNCSVYPRVSLPLSAGNLSSGFGALGGVVFPAYVLLPVQSLEKLAGGTASGPIVLTPCDFDAFADGSQRDVAHEQQAAKHTEGNAKLLASGGRSHLPDNVMLAQNGGDRNAELALNSQGVVLGGGDAVRSDVFVGGAELSDPTDGACVLHTGNLSSLPLGNKLGAAPRSAGVGRFMTPPQAHPYYTTVREISTRHYTGHVYNMHVEGDNSYTVNGACVHNCLCHLRWTVADNMDTVIANLRAELAAAERTMRATATLTGLVGPILRDKFVDLLLGDALAAGEFVL